MNVVDFVIISVILFGAYKGFKYGCFRSMISLIGSILVFVLAYRFKNPLSTFMYENLPFKSYGGIFKGISSFNILVYEGISYLACIVVLFTILKIIINFTGILDKIINLTLIFTLPSKILGIIFGAIEHYIYIFLALFVIAQIPLTASLYNESMLGNKMLKNTPLMSKVTNNLYNSVTEVYDICVKYKNNEEDKKQGDYESLKILMDYDIISIESVKILKEKGKIPIEGLDVLIAEFEGKR